MDDKRGTFETKMKTIYLKRLREMSGERRLEITSELFEAVKEVAEAGIKYQNPEISREKSKAELLKRICK